MNKNILMWLAFMCLQLSVAQNSALSVEKIMQDPKWMGTFPSDISWGIHSENVYFSYNPKGYPEDSLYRIHVKRPGEIVQVGWKQQQQRIPNSGDFNQDRTQKIYTRDGILFIYDIEKKEERQLLELLAPIQDPQFLVNEDRISFIYKDNAFLFHLDSGGIEKLTNIGVADKDKKEETKSRQDEWLQKENLDLLRVVRERKENEERTKQYHQISEGPVPFRFDPGKKILRNLKVSPNGDYVTFNLITTAESKETHVPDYTDSSGYTEALPARSKVGREPSVWELAIYDIRKDTVYQVKTNDLPGIRDLPDFVKDYPEKEWKKEIREVVITGPYFSGDGKRAVVNIRSQDNKDRWIAAVDLVSGELKTIDRQRDEAWIAGPGIGYKYSRGTLGWLPDNKTIYFQSEASGYSHLYTANVETGKKEQLTSGQFEVFDPFLSDNGNSWYLTTSSVHPGERHFYSMPLNGGKMKKLTQMTGNNQVFLSPNEKYLAILHSYSNRPWELYLKETASPEKAIQVTHGQSEAFRKYEWKDPKLVSFTAADGEEVPARLYLPTETAKNGAAVIFVHGAGYLQNAHKWWSSYFREYMFHNLLSDLGYTVLDIDYRGSSGYGRDWRTAIYRNMGGKDLSDQVSGAEFLVKEYDIDPERVGIYGGSYGGFITLMAMFREGETFAAGAALRSVTDWAHYNHGYTSNILNEPAEDPIAYRRSSPIYYAEGLQGDLLIAHGMIDRNVHFQDVVRLAQRLIELGKEDWEMAVYPVEGHGFVEPSSWTDEYRRILELFNKTLLNN